MDVIAEFFSSFTFSAIVGWIGIVTTVVIVAAVSIRSVVDVLKATGVFYPKWMDFIYKNENEKIVRTLEQLGILSRVKHFKSITQAIETGFTSLTDNELRQNFNSIVRLYIDTGPLVVGDNSEQKVDYFLNLRTAFCTDYTKQLVEILCSFIINRSLEEGIEYDCVVSRKSGLDLLGYHVALALDLRFVLFHDQRSILRNNNIRSFDYLPDNIANPIIVDDSCVGGSSIANMAKQFQTETGIKINHAFLLFTRDTNSVAKLRRAGVDLHVIEHFDDNKLKNILSGTSPETSCSLKELAASSKDTNNFIPSVNYHFWPHCNMHCEYCFTKFGNSMHTDHRGKIDSLKMVRELAEEGFHKISFSGGEPTMCEWFPELVEEAKKCGLTTMLTTNGTNLSNEYLEQLRGHLDWVSLSIDSLSADKNKKCGRFTTERVPDAAFYSNLAKMIKHKKFRLKINTVVSRINYNDDMKTFITDLSPERWKIFQVLPIEGINKQDFDRYLITEDEFGKFVSINDIHNKTFDIVIENNELMLGSYLMITPDGRFFDNSNGFYEYSSFISEVGIKAALSQINIDHKKFFGRKGLYNWKFDLCGDRIDSSKRAI